jgi:hypothetical protein
MPNATSAMPAALVLDWRHAQTGPPAPCVFGDGLTICRSPVRDVPCHKACAEAWIIIHATGPADRARLVHAYTPRASKGAQ